MVTHQIAGIAKGYGTSGRRPRLWRVWLVVCTCGWGSDDHWTQRGARSQHRIHQNLERVYKS